MNERERHHLLLLLGNLDTLVFIDDETRDAFVAKGRIYIGEDEKYLSFCGVGDPPKNMC